MAYAQVSQSCDYEIDPETKLTVDEIYEKLASIVTSDIDDDWTTATIRAVINADEDVTFQGIYTGARQNPDINLDVDASVNYFCTQSEVFDLILDLRRLLHKPGREPFNEVDFTVNQDGEYDLVFR